MGHHQSRLWSIQQQVVVKTTMAKSLMAGFEFIDERVTDEYTDSE